MAVQPKIKELKRDDCRIHRSLVSPLALLALAIAATSDARAGGFPDALESDPGRLGLMQGFPPPPDKRVTQPDSNQPAFGKSGAVQLRFWLQRCLKFVGTLPARPAR